MHVHDDDDDDDKKAPANPHDLNDLGDDIGERIGEGSDQDVKPV